MNYGIIQIMDSDLRWLQRLDQRLREGSYAQSRRTAAELARSGPGILEHALVLMQSDVVADRESACSIVGGLFSAHRLAQAEPALALVECWPILIQLASHDASPAVRSAAVEVLSWMDVPQVLPSLCVAAVDDDAVRLEATHALGAYGPDRWTQDAFKPHRDAVIAALIRLAADPNPHVREKAVISIGRGGHDTPVTREILLTALADPSKRVQGFAAMVLGRFREPRLRPFLESRLRDETELHATFYFSAAASLGDPELLPVVEEAAKTVHRLRQAANEPVPHVVDSAVVALRAHAGLPNPMP